MIYVDGFLNIYRFGSSLLLLLRVQRFAGRSYFNLLGVAVQPSLRRDVLIAWEVMRYVWMGDLANSFSASEGYQEDAAS